ncbi:sugar phosphate isomerase/epimerase family protein [Faunimonas sp. B44]|uniref:sugar phosphate isomerase/epimerase family protein n=1 Tax=Faunimonas sp. B44 TaxID=3461493 RepID=UPI00404503F1
MSIRERIGVDVGRKLSVEDAIRWAAGHEVRYLDVQTDLEPNALETIQARAPGIRRLLEETGVELGLHTLSGVNIAEISPFMRKAADDYLRAYTDMAAATGAGWVIVHAGYHFTDDYAVRRDAALERLARAVDHAERMGVLLLLENPNREPAQAEVKYLGATIEECLFYFDRLPSPALGFAFTANHAHLWPDGVQGFIDALDFTRCREVRLADCRGTVEEHLQPGDGTMDFGALFARLERDGFRGHYMNQFGSLDDMLRGRDHIVERAREAGVA